MKRLNVDVRGLPHPQGSMRTHVLPNGKVATRYPPTVWAWRHQVQQAVAEAAVDHMPDGPFEGPVELKLGFDLPRPLSHYGTGRNRHTLKASSPPWPDGKPDLDKLVRAICDAVTDARAWLDDAQVCVMRTAKRYVLLEQQPGVFITITDLTPLTLITDEKPGPIEIDGEPAYRPIENTLPL
jgi:Holliday junction resolvase RusA-like endonuclease